jgi:hypothetical protein
MELHKFIYKKEFENISLRLKNVQNELKLNSYNIFTLSSYNSYLENFHSDVISVLLNPNERHNHENVFLNLFFDYLISLNVNIQKDDYSLCEITREQGRIDIWVKDNTSKKSLIIENKINNAEDQDKQLENYYNYAKDSGFNVDAIIYLTLNGNKNAPITEIPELNNIIINIPAFANDQNDFTNGWLLKCYENSNDEHNRSFIYQYSKLIKHLSQVGMDKQIKDEFYAIINKDDGYNKSKAIAKLISGLEEYRADIFAFKIKTDYLPFKKIYRWRPNHWLFENFNDNGIIFKLDVHFHSDGSVRLDFWNPNQNEETQRLNTSTKLNSIGLLHDFNFGGFGGGMYKEFKMDESKNLESLDIELFNYVRQLFDKLRN